MSKKGIEEMIGDIEDFIDSCKFQTLSTTKIVVQKEELLNMLKELRMKMPSEIERCQKIMRNKEAILSDARSQAEQMVANAAKEASKLVDESDIVHLANEKANEIYLEAQESSEATLKAANQDADDIRIGAMQYTQETLLGVETIIQQTLIEETEKYNAFLDTLQASLGILTTNRMEIEASLGQGSSYEEQADLDPNSGEQTSETGETSYSEFDYEENE